MLDYDLAEIYGYEIKRFNEQIKRNIDRFPEDFILSRQKISFVDCKNIVHDRMIIIDYKTKDESIIIPGSSIKDTGNKFSTVIKIDSLKLSSKMNYLIFNEKEYIFK